jgi:iron-sulfur cluster repair protein YtfE (RIC family)
MFEPTKTVREYALEIPASTRIFEKLGIDYCCGGGKSLADACAQAGVAVDEVLSSLKTKVSRFVVVRSAVRCNLVVSCLKIRTSTSDERP